MAVFTLDDYVVSHIMTTAQAAVLRDAVAMHANILVAGDTSAGKTTPTGLLAAEADVPTAW